MWRLRATAGCTGAAVFLGHVIELRLNTVLSQNKGTQYRPQNTTILITGIPKKVPLILGNPHADRA